MRVHVRIVAGSLRGRKVASNLGGDVRPTPQMVREALFSILGNAVPDRLFVDLFAGSGVVGMEALSRGASQALFVERDSRQTRDIDHHLHAFGLEDQARLIRTDSYLWADRWQPPDEPINIFVSPPFEDYQKRPHDLSVLLQNLMNRVAADSVLLVQGEKRPKMVDLPLFQSWEKRSYGRNQLFIWQKE